MSNPSTSSEPGQEKRTDPDAQNVDRRKFLAAGAAIAAGAAVTGAAGITPKSAAAATTLAQDPRTMTVTMQLFGSGGTDPRAIQANIEEASRLLGDIVRGGESNNFGEWLRDASGDDDWLLVSHVSVTGSPIPRSVCG